MGQPPDPEEAITVSDQQMVITSEEKSTLKQTSMKDKDVLMNVFKSDGDVITSASASKREARRNVGERLKMRKSTPRPTMKGNGKKRFNASPSPSTNPELKRALADNGDREEGCKSGFKKNLMEELDMAAVSLERNTPNNIEVGGSSPTGNMKCKGLISSTEVSQSPRQESSHGAEHGLNREAPNGRQGEHVGPKTKGTFEDALVNLPDKDMGNKSHFENALELFQKGGPCVSTLFEVPHASHMMEETKEHQLAKGDATCKPHDDDDEKVTFDNALVIIPDKVMMQEIPPQASLELTDNLNKMAAQPILTLTSSNMAIDTTTFDERQLVPVTNLSSRVGGMEESNVQPKQSILYLANLDSAEALDRISSQPLQQVDAGEVHGAIRSTALIGAGSQTGEPIMEDDRSQGPNHEYLGNFPPLDKGRTKLHGQRSSGVNQYGAPIQGERASRWEPHLNEKRSQFNPSNDRGSQTQPSMAELFRNQPEPKGHHTFEPEKIKNMGFASSSNGVPSIYFSGSETQQLADTLGLAIVGKFSHSIPTSSQIQKALESMKFIRGWSWKYINAKHVLIQLDDLNDYSRLLNGPKDTPIWYVNGHPMRVFKWTPDFDVYCESPIAAVWCNLIGLPIHLYDHSALFAIGKLLGNPIQIDRATANKSRLSFARICVEIDITKPVPEDIILDMGGRVSIQNVKWDKIPAYCSDCRHVGHSSSTCYASGKKEKPPKRDYNAPMGKRNSELNQNTIGKSLHNNGNKVVTEWHRPEKEDVSTKSFSTALVPVVQEGSPYSDTCIPDVLEPRQWGERIENDQSSFTTKGRGGGARKGTGGSTHKGDGSGQPRGRSARKASSGPSSPILNKAGALVLQAPPTGRNRWRTCSKDRPIPTVPKPLSRISFKTLDLLPCPTASRPSTSPERKLKSWPRAWVTPSWVSFLTLFLRAFKSKRLLIALNFGVDLIGSTSMLNTFSFNARTWRIMPESLEAQRVRPFGSLTAIR